MLSAPSRGFGLGGVVSSAAAAASAAFAPTARPVASATLSAAVSSTAPRNGAAAETKAFTSGEEQMRLLASQPGMHLDEDGLFRLLQLAHHRLLELEKAPSPANSAQLQIGSAALNLCVAWMQLASSAGLVEGTNGLRTTKAAELACTAVASAVASDSCVAPSLLPSFCVHGGFGLFGTVLCHMHQSGLVAATKCLRAVATRYAAYAKHVHAGGDRRAVDSLAANVEAFHGGLFARLLELAGCPGRSLRVADFRDLVVELSGILSGVYDSTQVFEMDCLLSLQLSVALSCFCPGVPEQDAIEAIEWMNIVMRSLLDEAGNSAGHAGALCSPGALREWVEDSGLWDTLLQRAGCKTQFRAHQVFFTLLSRRALNTRDLVSALATAGALGLSGVPTSSRLATQAALLAAIPGLGSGMAASLCQELCAAIRFEFLDEEGVDLLVRATRSTLLLGVRVGNDLSQVPAVSHLLQYIHWACQLQQPPEATVEHARRELQHSLVPLDALEPLLPCIAAEALSLARSTSVLSEESSLGGQQRAARVLCFIAVDVSRAGVAASCRLKTSGDTERLRQISSDAVASLCRALPPIGTTSPLEGSDANAWVAAFVDAMACYLRLPDAQIATQQVGTLWSRMIVRPVLGLQVTAAAMQYFKLAFLAEPEASSALLAPLHMAHNPTPEVRLAYASIFCPASFEDDMKPPLSPRFFMPEVCMVHAVESRHDTSQGNSPPRFPHALRRSLDSSREEDTVADDMAASSALDAEALAHAAAAAGVVLPGSSASAPRLRLERIQAVEQQSSTLFGELTGYEVIERRLWDEFDGRGRVEDSDALQQRDEAAQRCLAALDQEIDGAGYAGRELASPLTEARAKFSKVCQLVAGHAVQHICVELQTREEAFARADEQLAAAQGTHSRLAARSKRLGRPMEPESGEALKARQAELVQANLELVVCLKNLALMAQLGLVEVVGTPGLARALRTVGAAHNDPLLDRVLLHTPWSDAQAEEDLALDRALGPGFAADVAVRGVAHSASAVPGVASAAKGGVITVAAADSAAAEAFRRLNRSEGLAGYADVQEVPSSTRVLAARRNGSAVALKTWADGDANACERELRALAALNHSPYVASLLGIFSGGGGRCTYLELAWHAGGTLQAWREQHPGVVGADDVESFVKCLGIFRHLWQAIAFLHGLGTVHGDVSLANVVLTSDHRPVLIDFKRCVFADETADSHVELMGATPGHEAPELEGGRQGRSSALPTAKSDVYGLGVTMAKAFLDLRLEVARCPYDARSRQRRLPDERADVDIVDLLQAALAEQPGERPTAADAAAHRALDPAQLLRRRGLLGSGGVAGHGKVGGGSRGQRASPSEALLYGAEKLREEYRSRRVEEPLMFSREQVFEAIARSRVSEWTEDALLGEWRVMLNDESGVDGGGLRREVVSLFFEQFEISGLVKREGADSDNPGVQATLFVADRQQAELSPQQWRQMWSSVGAMILRALVHFGNVPIAFSSSVFDCAFGRIGRLPPDDDHDGDDLRDPSAVEACVSRMFALRESRGDDWARSELLDWLRRLRQADPVKEESYRWLLAQRVAADAEGARCASSASSSYRVNADTLLTMDAMLEPCCFRLLLRSSHLLADGAAVHSGAVLEWVLLWDIYLKFLGSGDRWLAYEALAEGLTARGRRLDLWTKLTGEQVMEALEGAPLTPDVVIGNIEWKPNYGYDKQIQHFKAVLEGFSSEELSMFLRYATGSGRLPASRKFPGGQKLTIRFIPEDFDRLPSAHTCFWVVDVPPYEEVGDMRQKLRQAIAAPQPFYLS
eukprot:TRINITY_DN29247_c0_g2_i1.p1 TRINITY_DN29247_c0_g2~~TRINITY_DN29247_c0_g2_i1.p1  ORF type:complete len:1797 (-),score=347.22 TRINITY_DN29247_c0_g2_i1:136-5526(-)